MKYKNKYNEGAIVWVRPRLVDKPIQGIYIRSISMKENKEGYRNGEIVRINEKEIWIRSDLCDIDFDKIRKLNN